MKYQQLLKRFEHLGIDLRERNLTIDFCNPDIIRSFQVYESLKHSTCIKIKEFLNASDLIFRTEYSDERGQGPIIVEVIYA